MGVSFLQNPYDLTHVTVLQRKMKLNQSNQRVMRDINLMVNSKWLEKTQKQSKKQKGNTKHIFIILNIAVRNKNGS